MNLQQKLLLNTAKGYLVMGDVILNCMLLAEYVES